MFSNSLRDVTRFFQTLAKGATGEDDSAFFGEEAPKATQNVYAASAVVNILALALPITILQVYDRVLPNASFKTLNLLLIGVCFVLIVDFALKALRNYVVNWSASSFTHKLTRRSMRAIMTSPPSVHRESTTSDHLDRVSSISGFGDYLSGSSRLSALDMMFAPLFALVILIVGGLLFLVPLSLFAIFSYMCVHRSEKLRALAEEREKTEARKTDFIIEILRTMATVKSLAMEPFIMRRFERLQAGASNIVRQTITTTNAAQSQAAAYASISTVAIVSFGAILVIQDKLSMGGLACCMLLSSQLLQPLIRMLSAWNEIQLATLKRDRIKEIFDNSEPQTFNILATTQKNSVVQRPAEIILENVSIKHRKSQKFQFENLSLTIPGGALIAFRGEDGSGRTSLLRSLSGSFSPSSGMAMIGGVHLIGDNAPAIREAVRYVQQEPQTFRGTILENLTLFGATPTPACLWACKLIGLDTEITRMPLGYDTPLRGTSGGEIPASTAQRICIARALALRPAVLLLDEANTALDLGAEKALTAALNSLRGQMTVLIATHRPSLIRLCDAAYETRNGQVQTLDISSPPKKDQAQKASS